jgi:hypothetical protein
MTWPGLAERLTWPFDDPAATTGTDIEWLDSSTTCPGGSTGSRSSLGEQGALHVIVATV